MVKYSKKTVSREIAELLELPLLELITLADQSRAAVFGSTVEICSITNAKSGLCNQDCKFCAQAARYNATTSAYPLQTEQEILEAALKAEESGAERFGIVTSGRSVNRAELLTIVQAVAAIKTRTRLKVCASLGILGEEDLSLLRQAGLSRYHHNIETSPAFFPKVCTTHRFQERINTIQNAQKAGLEVCSGGIIGVGEDWNDRIEMALTLKELAVDAVPLNILIPIKGTPLESAVPLAPVEIIRTVAVFRIILKNQIIKVAAGRETALKDFQGLAFLAGANGLLIGGYLTVKGREVKEDRRLIQEILQTWQDKSVSDGKNCRHHLREIGRGADDHTNLLPVFRGS